MEECICLLAILFLSKETAVKIPLEKLRERLELIQTKSQDLRSHEKRNYIAQTIADAKLVLQTANIWEAYLRTGTKPMTCVQHDCINSKIAIQALYASIIMSSDDLSPVEDPYANDDPPKKAQRRTRRKRSINLAENYRLLSKHNKWVVCSTIMDYIELLAETDPVKISYWDTNTANVDPRVLD
jgi:hypothetical protein